MCVCLWVFFLLRLLFSQHFNILIVFCLHFFYEKFFIIPIFVLLSVVCLSLIFSWFSVQYLIMIYFSLYVCVGGGIDMLFWVFWAFWILKFGVCHKCWKMCGHYFFKYIFFCMVSSIVPFLLKFQMCLH